MSNPTILVRSSEEARRDQIRMFALTQEFQLYGRVNFVPKPDKVGVLAQAIEKYVLEGRAT